MHDTAQPMKLSAKLKEINQNVTNNFTSSPVVTGVEKSFQTLVYDVEDNAVVKPLSMYLVVSTKTELNNCIIIFIRNYKMIGDLSLVLTNLTLALSSVNDMSHTNVTIFQSF